VISNGTLRKAYGNNGLKADPHPDEVNRWWRPVVLDGHGADPVGRFSGHAVHLCNCTNTRHEVVLPESRIDD